MGADPRTSVRSASALSVGLPPPPPAQGWHCYDDSGRTSDGARGTLSLLGGGFTGEAFLRVFFRGTIFGLFYEGTLFACVLFSESPCLGVVSEKLKENIFFERTLFWGWLHGGTEECFLREPFLGWFLREAKEIPFLREHFFEGGTGKMAPLLCWT